METTPAKEFKLSARLFKIANAILEGQTVDATMINITLSRAEDAMFQSDRMKLTPSDFVAAENELRAVFLK